MLDTYRVAHPLLRRKIQAFETLFDIVRRMALEPEVVAMAREEGFERDPVVVGLVASRREGLLVARMYDDSITTHVRVTDAERRRFYDEHRKDLVAEEQVRYVMLFRASEAGADSALALIRSGTRPELIATADSLSGLPYGGVRTMERSSGSTYRNVLFEELKPGESTKLAWARLWIVLHVLGRLPSRPMSYEEARSVVDESVQNIESERLLHELLARQRRRHRIESHPEWVMRFSIARPIPTTVIPPDD